MTSSAKNTIKTPLAKARGLGPAHGGVHHWMAQRVTAISNAFLVVWLVWSVVDLRGAPYGEFTDWLSLPWNAVLMILLIVSAFYHAVLGGQVIVEDYIQCKALKLAKLIGMKLFFTALGVACIFSVLKVAL